MDHHDILSPLKFRSVKSCPVSAIWRPEARTRGQWWQLQNCRIIHAHCFVRKWTCNVVIALFIYGWEMMRVLKESKLKGRNETKCRAIWHRERSAKIVKLYFFFYFLNTIFLTSLLFLLHNYIWTWQYSFLIICLARW